MVDACGGHRPEPETKPRTPGRLPRRCWAAQADYEHQLFNLRLTATLGRLRPAARRAVATIGEWSRGRRAPTVDGARSGSGCAMVGQREARGIWAPRQGLPPTSAA
jgi:hypothetical protein